jgi:hypothetical protein
MGKRTVGGGDVATVVLLEAITTGAGSTAWVECTGSFNAWIYGSLTNVTITVEASRDGGTTACRVPKDSSLAALAVDNTIGNCVLALYEFEAGVLYRFTRTGAGAGNVTVAFVQ